MLQLEHVFVGSVAPWLSTCGVTSRAMEVPETLLGTTPRGSHDGGEPSASSFTTPEKTRLTSGTVYEGQTWKDIGHGGPEEDNMRLLASGGETNTLARCCSRVRSEHSLSRLDRHQIDANLWWKTQTRPIWRKREIANHYSNTYQGNTIRVGLDENSVSRRTDGYGLMPSTKKGSIPPFLAIVPDEPSP